MDNLVVKKYKNKKNQMILATFNDDGLIHNDNDDAAITLYDNNVEIASIFVNNGVIENKDNNPAINSNSDNSKYSIHAQYGIIHNDNAPAISFSKDNNSYHYHFKSGAIENINGPSIIKLNTKSSVHIYTKNNRGLKGYNCRIYESNKLKTKARIDFHIESFISLKIQEGDISDIFDKIDGYIEALNIQTENYNYPIDDNLPHIINLKEGFKIDKLMWLNKNGLHRIDKPSLIHYQNGNKVKFYHYEDGKGKDSLFMPHILVKNRRGKHVNILSFEFLDDDIQEYYNRNNLKPFFMSIQEREELEKTFKEKQL